MALFELITLLFSVFLVRLAKNESSSYRQGLVSFAVVSVGSASGGFGGTEPSDLRRNPLVGCRSRYGKRDEALGSVCRCLSFLR